MTAGGHKPCLSVGRLKAKNTEWREACTSFLGRRDRGECGCLTGGTKVRSHGRQAGPTRTLRSGAGYTARAEVGDSPGGERITVIPRAHQPNGRSLIAILTKQNQSH